MTRVMRDSITIGNIPVNTAIVATYINGDYAVNEAEFATHFPASNRVLIDVNGSDPGKASVRDWETGDKGGSLQSWVEETKQAGTVAIVYCNRTTIGEVRQLTGNQVLGKDYWLWVATLDGSEYKGGTNGVTPGDVIACQTHTAWAGNKQLYDESIVYADWWLAPPPPARDTLGSIPPGKWLANVRVTDGTWHVTSADFGKTWGRTSPGN